MPQLYRGENDQALETLAGVLEQYERDHPGSAAQYYRRNNVSIRIRIFDPHFAKLSRGEREELVESYLRKLPEDLQSDITLLLLFTPDEKKSLISMEFEDPIPSLL